MPRNLPARSVETDLKPSKHRTAPRALHQHPVGVDTRTVLRHLEPSNLNYHCSPRDAEARLLSLLADVNPHRLGQALHTTKSSGQFPSLGPILARILIIITSRLSFVHPSIPSSPKFPSEFDRIIEIGRILPSALVIPGKKASHPRVSTSKQCRWGVLMSKKVTPAPLQSPVFEKSKKPSSSNQGKSDKDSKSPKRRQSKCPKASEWPPCSPTRPCGLDGWRNL